MPIGHRRHQPGRGDHRDQRGRVLALLDSVAADPGHLDPRQVADHARDRDHRRDHGSDRHHGRALALAQRLELVAGGLVLRLRAGRHPLALRRLLGAPLASSDPCACAARPAFAPGSPSARRLEPGLGIERRAQLPRRVLGVVGVADRAHDDRLAARRRATTSPTSRRRSRRSRTTGPRVRPSAAACSISASPAAGRPALVGVSQTGPALSWSGRASPSAAQRGVELRRAVGREADQRVGPGAARLAAATGSSSWPTWTPSAPQASTRPGSSLRKKSAPCSRAARGERLGEGEQLLGAARRLLAQLDHVDAAGDRGLEQRAGIGPVRLGLADEVQAGGGERPPAGREQRVVEALVQDALGESVAFEADQPAAVRDDVDPARATLDRDLRLHSGELAPDASGSDRAPNPCRRRDRVARRRWRGSRRGRGRRRETAPWSCRGRAPRRRWRGRAPPSRSPAPRAAKNRSISSGFVSPILGSILDDNGSPDPNGAERAATGRRPSEPDPGNAGAGRCEVRPPGQGAVRGEQQSDNRDRGRGRRRRRRDRPRLRLARRPARPRRGRARARPPGGGRLRRRGRDAGAGRRGDLGRGPAARAGARVAPALAGVRGGARRGDRQ